jgi:hypothetical protein
MFRILIYYRLRHLVNNVAIHTSIYDGVHFLIDLKTRAVAPFFPDVRTFHNIYKLQKHVLLRHQ